MNKRSFPDDWPVGKPRNDTHADNQGEHAAKPTYSEIIELAWCDDTTFDSIKSQTGMAEKDVIKLMRSSLKPSSFKLWRKRVSGRVAKHEMRSSERNEKRRE